MENIIIWFKTRPVVWQWIMGIAAIIVFAVVAFFTCGLIVLVLWMVFRKKDNIKNKDTMPELVDINKNKEKEIFIQNPLDKQKQELIEILLKPKLSAINLKDPIKSFKAYYPITSLKFEKKGKDDFIKYKDISINIGQEDQSSPINQKITFLLHVVVFLGAIMLIKTDETIINNILNGMENEINNLPNKITDFNEYISDMLKKYGYKEPTEEESKKSTKRIF